jgi:hypothetical protein
MATQTKTQREQAGKKAAATRKRNAASRSTTATRRSATQTRRTAKRTTRSASRSAAQTGQSARTTALTASTAVARELDAATNRVEALALGARRGVAIQVGAALEAGDAVKRTAQFAVRTANRRRTLNRLERRGERALSWNKR